MKRGCPLCVRSSSDWLVIRILCHCERNQKQQEANRSQAFGRGICPLDMLHRAVLAPSAWISCHTSGCAMGCAASSRIQPHPAQVAEDRKATAEFERQLAKARAAQAANTNAALSLPDRLRKRIN